MLGATGIVGRLVTGGLLDRFFAPRIAVVMLLVAGAGTLVLAYATSPFTALTGTALLGFSLGSEADITPYLISRYFGRKNSLRCTVLPGRPTPSAARQGPCLWGTCTTSTAPISLAL